MTTYRMELRCGCPDDVQDDLAFTDDEGLALIRARTWICGGCWENYVLVSVCTADPAEIPSSASPLPVLWDDGAA